MPATSIRIDWQRVALNLRSHGIQLQAGSRRLGKHAGWLGQHSRERVHFALRPPRRTARARASREKILGSLRQIGLEPAPLMGRNSRT